MAVRCHLSKTTLFLAVILLASTANCLCGDWALQPLVRPAVPEIAGTWGNSPIDRLIAARHLEKNLTPAVRATRRALIRRAYFDLTGLPPSPEQVDAFVNDPRADAFEQLVDQLLASPRYGERWARHWMDLVHFAETHGHDEDAIRENAWPYRDYLVRSFNADKPYARFIEEQLAGDVLFKDDPWATVATGFLAAGPWDSSSQMGIQDGTIDKKIAQYLDRDDMLTATMSTFTSLTVHCARCHDHKFDPVRQQDYYALQAVFAGVDRADRPYDTDPQTKRARFALLAEKKELEAGRVANSPLTENELADWEKGLGKATWAVMESQTLESSSGSKFKPLDDGSFLFSGERPERDTYTIRGRSPLARISAVQLEVLSDPGLPLKGPGRQDNGNLHLSEFRLQIAPDREVKIARAQADWDQAGWTIAHALDGNEKTAWGIYPKVGESHRAMFVLEEPLDCSADTVLSFRLAQLHGGGHLIGRPRISVSSEAAPAFGLVTPPAIEAILKIPAKHRTPEAQNELLLHYLKERNRKRLATLPKPGTVFAVASQFTAKGNFKPAGKARSVHFLRRGDIHQPGAEAKAGAVKAVPGLQGEFDLPADAGEGKRRAALAKWLSAKDNMLTWRSMANRVWQHHFGRGIVATPNDFGKMGAAPSHPQLLDWLSCELRDHGGSLKHLHRLIMNSATYQLASRVPEQQQADPGNQLYWRGELRRLDAESIRDSILAVSGKLDLRMGGPSARQFEMKPGIHVTPTLDYIKFDPDDPANFRRSLYRFNFRTVPDPFMQALDCPDASQLVPRRDESVSAQQALALMNQRFVVRQSEHCAERLQRETKDNLPGQIDRLVQLAYGRPAAASERHALIDYATDHGLANACRMVFNSNEFVFVE